MPELASSSFADHLKPLALLALNTGMRRGELFNLKWSDVDMEKPELEVRGEEDDDGTGSKSGQTRTIPLTREGLEVLRDWQSTTGAADGLVFPAEDGGRMTDIKTAWGGLLRAAGIKGFRFHDLRHTFASWLVMRGTDLYTVRDLLGHASIQMTERYAHLAPEHRAAAVADFGPPAR